MPLISPERQLEIALESHDRRSALGSPLEQEVRCLHGFGLDDREIAERAGVYPRSVARIRERLGLSSNSKGGVHKEAVWR